MGNVTPEPIRDAHFDGRMIDELRQYVTAKINEGRLSFGLTRAEVEALLAAADERDALKREATDDPRPSRSRARMVLELSDDADDVARALARYLEPSVLRAALKIANPKAEPADDRDIAKCRHCDEPIFRGGVVTAWAHLGGGSDHYAEPPVESAMRTLYPCAVCSLAIYERAPRATDVVGRKYYAHADIAPGAYIDHAATRA